ncbi:hydrolase, family 31 [Seminavis robusta]|uniref:Hydrolase, family 31 n=1 Tax=Seminavis robusta TaxID=568900 RepID=A0A9N8HJQ2_9STRA|nr:hydrolase, family 31 [Seminavis robusta]|eukprot:Sro678_g185890.1 hydrolase, family 31 (261) ;mRNA; r:8914-9852
MSLSLVVTQIGPTTSLLRSNESDNEVYLLGTAHISEASANEAIQLIQLVQPNKVFVELDPVRAARLRATEQQQQQQQGTEEDPLEQAMKDAAQQLAKTTGGALPPALPNPYGGGNNESNFFGDSFKLFYKILHVNDTLREIKAAFSPALLMKLLSAPPTSPQLQALMMDIAQGGLEGLGDATERLKTREHARMISSYMDTTAPEVAHALIHRRDMAMAQNLRKHCGQGKVVAVVGLAHVDGIEKEWEKLSSSTGSRDMSI